MQLEAETVSCRTKGASLCLQCQMTRMRQTGCRQTATLQCSHCRLTRHLADLAPNAVCGARSRAFDRRTSPNIKHTLSAHVSINRHLLSSKNIHRVAKDSCARFPAFFCAGGREGRQAGYLNAPTRPFFCCLCSFRCFAALPASVSPSPGVRFSRPASTFFRCKLCCCGFVAVRIPPAYVVRRSRSFPVG